MRMKSALTSDTMLLMSTEIRLNPSTFQVMLLNSLSSTNFSDSTVFTGASEEFPELSEVASLTDHQGCHSGPDCQGLLYCYPGHQQKRCLQEERL